jgi:hypothetical protein
MNTIQPISPGQGILTEVERISTFDLQFRLAASDTNKYFFLSYKTRWGQPFWAFPFSIWFLVQGVIILNVVTLNVIILNVIMLNVIMLNVVASFFRLISVQFQVNSGL